MAESGIATKRPNQGDGANAARLDYDLIRNSTFHLQPCALSAAQLIVASVRPEAIANGRFDGIMEKYGDRPFREHFETVAEINQFAVHFYRDAADIYDAFTRLKDFERNPSGYSLDDAPILGLLVRIWKLLKETIRYHVENNAEFIAIFQRTLLETAVTATYLLKHDQSVVEDFRKCSYKDRLRILQDAKNGSAFRRLRRVSACCDP